MRLGLITDIHEQIEDLRNALARLDELNVDRILCLGDVFQTGEAIRETVALLAERSIAGVWGNHDFGLCGHPSALKSRRRAEYAGPVLDYLATYRPFLEVDDCFFSHVEPWRKLNHVMGLWYLGGPPDVPAKAAKSFAACASRVIFTGHHHCWLAATREEVLPWAGAEPLRLEPSQRYLVVVGAVCEGQCAVYDSQSCELSPIALR